MLYKIIKYLALVLALVGIIFGVMIMTKNTEELRIDGTLLDNMIYVTYAVLGIILALVIIYVIVNMFSSKQAMMSTLKGVGAFLVVAIIAYSVADGTEVVQGGETFAADKVKWVNTGLNLFYGLAIVAVGSMAWSGVSKMIK